MTTQPLLEDSHIVISYDHAGEWLVAEWRGDQSLSSVQRGGQEMLRLLGQQQCRKVLNDNTAVTNMWSEAAEWAGTEWFPAMTAAGLQYFAWVYSPNTYSRLSTDLTLQFTGLTPVVATFDDAAAAAAWLRQQ